MFEIVLVRHGETTGQSSIRLYGATDLPLSDEGEAQVAARGRALAGTSFDRVFASPMIRARRSAEIVLDAMTHPSRPIAEIEAFREVDFGAWEGWTWAEVEARDPENFARFRADRDSFSFPGGSSLAAFAQRVQAAVEPELLAHLDARHRRALVVVHKGVIKRVAARLLGTDEPDGWALPLASAYTLRAETPAGPWQTAARMEGSP